MKLPLQDLLATLAAAHCRVHPSALRAPLASPRGEPRRALARRLAIVLLYRHARMTHRQIAAEFGIAHEGNVSRLYTKTIRENAPSIAYLERICKARA